MPTQFFKPQEDRVYLRTRFVILDRKRKAQATPKEKAEIIVAHEFCDHEHAFDRATVEGIFQQH